MLSTPLKKSATYGLKLNEEKSETININSEGVVNFRNGEQVKQTSEAKYLGCLLNDDNEARKEMNKRFADTRTRTQRGKNWKNFGNTETTTTEKN